MLISQIGSHEIYKERDSASNQVQKLINDEATRGQSVKSHLPVGEVYPAACGNITMSIDWQGLSDIRSTMNGRGNF